MFDISSWSASFGLSHCLACLAGVAMMACPVGAHASVARPWYTNTGLKSGPVGDPEAANLDYFLGQIGMIRDHLA